MKLTKEQILRYKKHISLPAIGIDGQIKLKKNKVLIIGAGGLGCPIALYLAGAGIGLIACIDPDSVEIHNLHRQIAHHESSVGTPKVISLKKQLEQLNSDIIFRPIHAKISPENIYSYIQEYDIIIDGCDNFKTRYLVNDACVFLKKPLVYGSVLNFEIQMAVFNYKEAKDLRAIFPEAPDPEDVPSCDLNGVMSTTPGILGLMMAQEAIKLILDLPSLKNELLIVDTERWETKKINY
ncbi:HesA/MoeB/ThiF family protein [Sphingobacterium sp. LRF_L2]|uniref:HesA/MoeB/ThiF family protein n=1 Tax=Sphingobacterium sp. LRF_L2 TaxID=3369421 RepID=UPI003F5D80ED